MNRKGNAAVIAVIILAVLLLLVWLMSVASRECSSTKDCPDHSYCGVDYECHSFPEQIIIKEPSGLLLPSLIVAVGLIIAALIMRGKKKE